MKSFSRIVSARDFMPQPTDDVASSAFLPTNDAASSALLPTYEAASPAFCVKEDAVSFAFVVAPQLYAMLLLKTLKAAARSNGVSQLSRRVSSDMASTVSNSCTTLRLAST